MWENLVDVEAYECLANPIKCIYLSRNRFFDVVNFLPNVLYKVETVPDLIEPWNVRFVRCLIFPCGQGLDVAYEGDWIIDNGDGTYTTHSDPSALMYPEDIPAFIEEADIDKKELNSWFGLTT